MVGSSKVMRHLLRRVIHADNAKRAGGGSFISNIAAILFCKYDFILEFGKAADILLRCMRFAFAHVVVAQFALYIFNIARKSARNNLKFTNFRREHFQFCRHRRTHVAREFQPFIRDSIFFEFADQISCGSLRILRGRRPLPLAESLRRLNNIFFLNRFKYLFGQFLNQPGTFTHCNALL